MTDDAFLIASKAEFVAIGEQLERERSWAAEHLQRVLDETPRKDWPALVTRRALATSGCVEHLCSIAAAAALLDPPYAVDVAQLAVNLSNAIAPSAYRDVITCQTRAAAWRTLGDAWRSLQCFEESMDALRRADQHLHDCGALAHDAALVSFSRALTLQEMGRSNEALKLLRRAGGTFMTFGDLNRWRLCRGIVREIRERRTVAVHAARHAH